MTEDLLMIRPAKHSDVPRLVELATMLHATSSFAKQGFNPAKTGNFMHDLINGAGVIFVAEIDGVVVGGVAGGITENWFNDELVAYDYSVFIEPAKRSGITAIRLINTFQEWARIKGARHVQLGIGTMINIEGTSKLYQHLGFEPWAPLFQKEIV